MQMIHKNDLPVETHWQKELSTAFKDFSSLAKFLELDESMIPNSIAEHDSARQLFPMLVPRHFAQLMNKRDWSDPLLQQVIPQASEYSEQSGFVKDPLNEEDYSQKGLIHKYKSRLLLIMRSACAVNCRYCFRRHYPYSNNRVNKREFDDMFSYINQHQDVNEVILSGGDPLMATESYLYQLSEKLQSCSNIKRLRIHTRLPVVIPNRINIEFLEWVSSLNIPLVMVFHINHPNEVSRELIEKCTQLKSYGVILLNQSVLLRGINDDVQTLQELSEALFSSSILPYYLHMLDEVEGAAHFHVSKDDARKLMGELIASLPGFLVPKLVKEIADRRGKTPIDLHLDI